MDTEKKDLMHYKNSAEQDYSKTPESVLEYINELENRLKEALINWKVEEAVNEWRKDADKQTRQNDKGS